MEKKNARQSLLLYIINSKTNIALKYFRNSCNRTKTKVLSDEICGEII